MKTIQWGLMASAILLSSCNSAPKAGQTCPKDNVQTCVTDSAWNIQGTYKGVLPAADCEGIQTTLTLNDDTTYRLVNEYLGKSGSPVETNGVYEKMGNDLIVLITPSSGEKTYYKLQKDAAVLTDSLGTENKGELADLYVLKKVE